MAKIRQYILTKEKLCHFVPNLPCAKEPTHPPPHPSQVLNRQILFCIVFLKVDEMIDSGIILESDASLVASRSATRSAEADIPLGEQTVAQVLATAKEQIKWTLLK